MTQTDPREIHQQAMAQTELIVAAVEPGQLTLPTPCAGYDVRALLSHIVGGLNRIALMGEGADAMAVPPRADGVPDDGWLAAYRTARARVIAAWADDARLDALIEVPWGKVPGHIAVSGYVQEVPPTAGTWPGPPASPPNSTPGWPPGCWPSPSASSRPSRGDREIPFGPVMPVPPGAGPYTQLAAWLGRQP